MDENANVDEEWNPAQPSPRTLISNFLNDEFSLKPLPNPLGADQNGGTVAKSEQLDIDKSWKEEEADSEFQFSSGISFSTSMFDAHKPSPRVGLAERMASRAGFSAPKINTACIRFGNLDSSTSEMKSPYLTIPPGLSPTSLLDSPVFLSNMVQPSPTTGKLLFEQCNSTNAVSAIAVPDKIEDHSLDDVPESFALRPHVELSSSYLSNADKKLGLPHIEVSVQSVQSVRTGTIGTMAIPIQNQHDFKLQAGFGNSSDQKDPADDAMFGQKASDSLGGEQSPPLDDQLDGEGDPKGEFTSAAAGAPAGDGYNWRKYGQKQVKSSEYPRSYYKCTHPHCPVKKKVERSHDGHITEIIYKGAHNHPKPIPNRRSGVVSSHPFNKMQLDGSENTGWGSSENCNGGNDRKNDALDATSSGSLPPEFGDPSAAMWAQDGARFESPDVAIDVSSTLSNDEEDDQATHGSVSLGGDGEGDESESKRRKIDASVIEMSAASRAVREPRVVVQTTSEVDILDDGYRWRKYGQKVVKGNPNPRSYYKCTNPGCTVRKHVERASHDLRSVITTYEGKHNHDVPAARSSGHSNSGPSTTAATTAPQPQSLHRQPDLTQPQESLRRFNAPAPLAAFGISRDRLAPPHGNFTFAMGQQGLSNLGIAGLSAVPPVKMPVLPSVHSYLGCHQLTEPGYMMAKGEPKDEAVPESNYQRMMSRLPLGPQL